MSMEAEEKTIQKRRCFIYDCGSRDTLLIQPIGDHDLQTMDNEAGLIRDLCKGRPFTMVMFLVDWNRDLPPWRAEQIRGDEPFGCGAPETLDFIREHLIPDLAGGRARASSEAVKLLEIKIFLRIFARLKKRKAFWCNGVFETED